MTVIYLTEYNTECYGLIFQNNGCVKVQKFKNISNDDDNKLLSTDENSVEPFHYHVSNCGKDSLKNCEHKNVIQVMIRTVDIN